MFVSHFSVVLNCPRQPQPVNHRPSHIMPTDTLANIIIVDDTPANLQLLESILTARSYRVRPFPRADLALRAVENDPPDLILLDINMPGMNGYDLCIAIKSRPHLQDIPVIFISALAETFDKVKAFSVGGVDYISKPFQFEEVLARVATHLHLRQTQRQLQTGNDQLLQANQQLRELKDLRDKLTDMIVHDMRNPLMVIKGYLQLLEIISSQPGSEERVRRYLREGLVATQTVVEMISSMLDVSRMESNQLQLTIARHDLTALAQDAARGLASLFEQKSIRLSLPERPSPVDCDGGLVSRVFTNLLGNAVKFTPAGGSVAVEILTNDGHLVAAISDSGPGIPREYHDRIFEKFGQVGVRNEGQKYSTGLGLTFCKLAIEAHRGSIQVNSEPGQGSTFRFTLPSPAHPAPPGGA